MLKPGFVAANRAALDKVAARTGSLRGGGRLRRRRPRPLQRGRGVRGRRGRRPLPEAAAPQLRRVRRAALLRARRGAPHAVRDRRREGGRGDLRGRVERRGPHRRPVGRRRRARRDPQRLAVLPGPARRARADGRHPRRGRPLPHRLREPGGRPGRADLRRRRRSWSTTTATWSHRSPQLSEAASTSSTSTSGRCSAPACSIRAAATPRRPCPVVPVSAAVADHPGDAAARRRSTRCSPPVDEVYDALGARHARLRREERLHRRRVRPVGRHRLVARRR